MSFSFHQMEVNNARGHEGGGQPRASGEGAATCYNRRRSNVPRSRNRLFNLTFNSFRANTAAAGGRAPTQRQPARESFPPPFAATRTGATPLIHPLPLLRRDPFTSLPLRRRVPKAPLIRIRMTRLAADQAGSGPPSPNTAVVVLSRFPFSSLPFSDLAIPSFLLVFPTSHSLVSFLCRASLLRNLVFLFHSTSLHFKHHFRLPFLPFLHSSLLRLLIHHSLNYRNAKFTGISSCSKLSAGNMTI